MKACKKLSISMGPENATPQKNLMAQDEAKENKSKRSIKGKILFVQSARRLDLTSNAKSSNIKLENH